MSIFALTAENSLNSLKLGAVKIHEDHETRMETALLLLPGLCSVVPLQSKASSLTFSFGRPPIARSSVRGTSLFEQLQFTLLRLSRMKTHNHVAPVRKVIDDCLPSVVPDFFFVLFFCCSQPQFGMSWFIIPVERA